MGIPHRGHQVPARPRRLAEPLPAAKRAATANNANLLAMGAFWTAPRLAQAMADALLEGSLGEDYEDWNDFHEYHRIGYDEWRGLRLGRLPGERLPRARPGRSVAWAGTARARPLVHAARNLESVMPSP